MTAVNDLKFLASALETPSIKGMAKTLNVPPPISCRALLAAFAVTAQPREPNQIWPIISGSDEDGAHVPVTGLQFSWSDPGAGHYWAATNYDINLVVETTNVSLFKNTTSHTSLVCNITLPYDTSLRWDLTAKNQFGQRVSQGYFGTADKPSGTPPPQTLPQPSDGTHCRSIVLTNCSSDHYTVHLWVRDVTANGDWIDEGVLDAQYDQNGTCPAPGSNPIVFDLVDGHTYWCVLVAPDQQACGGSNDPQNANCIAWPGNLVPQKLIGSASAPPFPLNFTGA